jgi:hypothetical protein
MVMAFWNRMKEEEFVLSRARMTNYGTKPQCDLQLFHSTFVL